MAWLRFIDAWERNILCASITLVGDDAEKEFTVITQFTFTYGQMDNKCQQIVSAFTFISAF